MGAWPGCSPKELQLEGEIRALWPRAPGSMPTNKVVITRPSETCLEGWLSFFFWPVGEATQHSGSSSKLRAASHCWAAHKVQFVPPTHRAAHVAAELCAGLELCTVCRQVWEVPATCKGRYIAERGSKRQQCCIPATCTPFAHRKWRAGLDQVLHQGNRATPGQCCWLITAG